MCSWIHTLQWKNQKYFIDFWSRKFTMNVKLWHCLTPCHYSNSQNSIISFDYSWFLDKNLSNFVFLRWKLHNRHCHTVHLPQVALQLDHVDHCISHGLVLQFSLLFDGPSQSLGRIPCWIKERKIAERKRPQPDPEKLWLGEINPLCW